MNGKRRPILVFGATGRQGGAVARALLREGWPVRAMVRDPMLAASLALRDAGAQLVRGAFTDQGLLAEAMARTDGVFSVLPGSLPQEEEVRIGTMIADMALQHDVPHLVYSSGASAGDRPTGVERFDAKPKIEAHIRSLPMTWTIVRPMIFMDMLLNPAFGLGTGQYRFLLRPGQAMQVVAVEDIGRFVAAVFADRPRFGGATLKLASDAVTGEGLARIFSEAGGSPMTYARLDDALLGGETDLGQIAHSLEAGPLAEHADLDALRAINPDLLSLRTWSRGAGRPRFEAAMAGQAGAGRGA